MNAVFIQQAQVINEDRKIYATKFSAIVRDMYSAKVSEENQGAWCIYEKYNTHVYIHIRDHIGLVI